MPRGNWRHGEDSPVHKLTEAEVIELRSKWDRLYTNLMADNEPLKGYKYHFCLFHAKRTKVPVSYRCIQHVIEHTNWVYLDQKE